MSENWTNNKSLFSSSVILFIHLTLLIFYLMTEFVWESDDPDWAGSDAGNSIGRVHTVAGK